MKASDFFEWGWKYAVFGVNNLDDRAARELMVDSTYDLWRLLQKLRIVDNLK
jgi:hypothetical protein